MPEATGSRINAWLIDRYLDGRLPIPGPLVQGLLKVAVECYFRFARTYPELPPAWGGGTGPVAEQSKDLMAIHYDKPAALFENFLGPTMKYTMALWERGATNLEAAQEAMLDDLCTKAQLRDGDQVLDIACGFGSLSAHIMKHYPRCKVVAMNLSKAQVGYITEKQSEPGHPLHTDRFKVIREDFNTFQFDQKVDRVMVIGLFEHIKNLRVALEKLSHFLKPGGTVLLHFITYQRIIRQLADLSQDVFFNKYIFPGGRFWYFHELPKHNEHLKVEQSWFLNGHNYQHTLEAWLENFWHNIDTVRAIPGIDEKFVRTWDLYLRFCIATFGAMGGRNVGNGQYLLRHAQPAG
jgi:cyclopropane-fatty-acyl-phospholipid synthase